MLNISSYESVSVYAFDDGVAQQGLQINQDCSHGNRNVGKKPSHF